LKKVILIERTSHQPIRSL